MTKQPLVTVITVVYNIIENGRKDFLIQNFESVHNQTYKNIEHLIIDGASTDGTLDILKEYADRGWIRYISEKDNGIFDAMNKGHKNAKGEYALVLNSDDWYASNDVIEHMVNKAVETNADYVYGSQRTLSRSGRYMSTWSPSIHAFWALMPFNHPTIMIKNSIVEKEGFYRTDFSTTEDYRFVIQLILKDYKGVDAKKKIVNFREGGASYSPDDKVTYYDWLYNRISKVLYWFYSQFDDRITEENIIEKYCYFNGGKFDDLFYIRLIKFMIGKKLKNFNYNDFLSFIEAVRLATTKNATKQIKKFKLLGCPILTIKKDLKGSKTYKLFSFLPILKIKTK
ncbi:MAG: glycosyltransferase [Alphaproteobacteria bacterium]|nr:glycosyltransferase [Alphaproteobacteria bacterium]